MVLKKGKHGAWTGNTQRRNPVLKSICKKEGYITKTVNYGANEQLGLKKKSDLIDDGELSCSNSAIDAQKFSLNKKKRWLIPENARSKVIEEAYRNERISQTFQGTNSRKRKKQRQANAKNVGVDYEEEAKSRTVIIQRALMSGESVCHSVYDTKNKTQPIRESRKCKSHLVDMLQDPHRIEVKYEIQTGMQSQSWPYQVHSQQHKNIMGKPKACRQKDHWKEDQQCLFDSCLEDISYDIDIEYQEFSTWEESLEKEDDTEENQSVGLLKLEDFIVEKVQKKAKSKVTEQVESTSSLRPCNPASTDLVKFSMKNSMVFNDVEDVIEEDIDIQNSLVSKQGTMVDHPTGDNSDSNDEIENSQASIGSKNLSYLSDTVLSNCEEITINVASSSICATDLRQMYGNAYVEGSCFPRRFAVILQNSQVQHISPRGIDCFLIVEELKKDINGETTMLRLKFFALQANVNKILKCPGTAEQPTLDFHAIVSSIQKLCPIKLPETKSTVKNMYPSSILKKLTKWQPRNFSIQNAISQLFVELLGNSNVDTNSLEDVCQEYGYLTPDMFCGICLNEIEPSLGLQFNKNKLQGTQLKECLHTFCGTCWEAYLSGKIRNKSGKIFCPAYKCDSVVDMVTVLSIVSSDLAAFHLGTCFENTIAVSSIWQWCPGCERLASCDGFQNTQQKIGLHDLPVIRCACKRDWCFSCQSDSHWPASCSGMLKYKEILSHEIGNIFDSSGNIYQTTVELKRCPFCRTPINKQYGCNHMACRCGKSFCWNCLKPFNTHSHESCHKVDVSLQVFTSLDESGLNSEKRYLRKIVRYTERRRILSKRRTKLGLDRGSSQAYLLHLENSKRALLKSSLKFLCDASTVLECVAVTILTSKSKHYNRRLLRFLDSTEFLFNEAMDALNVSHVDKIDFHKLNNLIKSIEQTLEKLKKMGL